MRGRRQHQDENKTMNRNRNAMNGIETTGGAMTVRHAPTFGRFRQGVVALVIAALAGICLFASASAAKAAPYGIESASAELSTNQAGAHPNLKIDFKLTNEEATGSPQFATKTVVTNLPPGLVGNVTNFATCDIADVIRTTNSTTPENYEACPRTATVGYMDVAIRYGYFPFGFTLRQRVYRLPSNPGEPAAFGTSVLSQPIRLTAAVRSDGDYGLTVTADQLPEPARTATVSTVFWGVPADHQGGGATAPMFDGNPIFQTEPYGPGQYFGNPLEGMPRTPLLTNPTSCTGQELTTGLGVVSWGETGKLITAGMNTPAITGCEHVEFKPTISVKPNSQTAGQPSGLQVDLKVPQTNDGGQLATSTLKDAVVTMPKGMTLSTALAEGLEGCTDSQFGLHVKAPDSCPSASKIGTVQINTPLLEAPMTGTIYAGSQESSDPTSGRMYRIFTTAEGSGVLIKLEGKLSVDPASGQITTTFSDNPQLPFSDFTLKFKGGEHAPLVLPQACGEYRAVADLTPYSAPTAPVETWGSFKVDQGCGSGQGFKPGFEAGTTNPIGGSYSPFTLRVTRADGQQNISTIDSVLPEGLLAKLAGVPLCGDSDAASGNCPAASQVGSATVGSGAGNSPLYVPQPGKEPTGVYLAGPYKEAPYSLVVKVPAQAGPFNLGTVAVRNALHIDPVTTQVTTKSDPLPQVLGGIPISYRDVRIDVDRSEFTINPTSCAPMQVKGTIGSGAGSSANVADRFQVADCQALGLAPKLAFKFSGAPTRRGGHPKLTATLTTKSGDANLRRVQVTLPKTEYLENAHIRTVCTRVQYAAGQCPEKSIYGYARAWTPLLDKPLEGPVYLRSSDHKLPDLVASLDGQIHIDLDGRINSFHSRIRNTFDFVPDAPVTKFVLTMQGGAKGLLVNNTNLCKAKPVASVEFNGQNGKVAKTNPKVAVGGCGKKGNKTHKGHKKG
jgi:hypothetical protein